MKRDLSSGESELEATFSLHGSLLYIHLQHLNNLEHPVSSAQPNHTLKGPRAIEYVFYFRWLFFTSEFPARISLQSNARIP